MNKAAVLHQQGCNCCQSVVMAYGDKLPIAATDAMNVAAPFGRGLAGTHEVCGCVSGMAMVCGLTAHTGDVRTLVEKFRKENGDIVCGRLLRMGKRPCKELITEAAGLLHSTVE